MNLSDPFIGARYPLSTNHQKARDIENGDCFESIGLWYAISKSRRVTGVIGLPVFDEGENGLTHVLPILSQNYSVICCNVDPIESNQLDNSEQ